MPERVAAAEFACGEERGDERAARHVGARRRRRPDWRGGSRRYRTYQGGGLWSHRRDKTRALLERFLRATRSLPIPRLCHSKLFICKRRLRAAAPMVRVTHNRRRPPSRARWPSVSFRWHNARPPSLLMFAGKLPPPPPHHLVDDDAAAAALLLGQPRAAHRHWRIGSACCALWQMCCGTTA